MKKKCEEMQKNRFFFQQDDIADNSKKGREVRGNENWNRIINCIACSLSPRRRQKHYSLPIHRSSTYRFFRMLFVPFSEDSLNSVFFHFSSSPAFVGSGSFSQVFHLSSIVSFSLSSQTVLRMGKGAEKPLLDEENYILVVNLLLFTIKSNRHYFTQDSFAL